MTCPSPGAILPSWTIGGYFAAYTWLWMLVGKERILLGGAIEAAEARMIVERMKARFAFPEMPTVS